MFYVNNFVYSVRRNLPTLLLCLSKSSTSRPVHQIRTRLLVTNAALIPARTDASRFDRTHYCGSLSVQNEGERVSVCGWVQVIRYQNFLVLRDVKGLIQVCLDDDNDAHRKLIAGLSQESVVLVRGVVRKRPPGQENLKMSTGRIEIRCEQIEVLSRAKDKLPFEISDFNRPGEAVRLKYRYLDLRFFLIS